MERFMEVDDARHGVLFVENGVRGRVCIEGRISLVRCLFLLLGNCVWVVIVVVVTMTNQMVVMTGIPSSLTN